MRRNRITFAGGINAGLGNAVGDNTALYLDLRHSR
jgi:hypothetical protein